jgi:hypothetical protein
MISAAIEYVKTGGSGKFRGSGAKEGAAVLRPTWFVKLSAV